MDYYALYEVLELCHLYTLSNGWLVMCQCWTLVTSIRLCYRPSSELSNARLVGSLQHVNGRGYRRVEIYLETEMDVGANEDVDVDVKIIVDLTESMNVDVDVGVDIDVDVDVDVNEAINIS